jgi:hypothetical protein
LKSSETAAAGRHLGPGDRAKATESWEIRDALLFPGFGNRKTGERPYFPGIEKRVIATTLLPHEFQQLVGERLENGRFDRELCRLSTGFLQPEKISPRLLI